MDPTPEGIEEQLVEAAGKLPDEYRPPSESWGLSFAQAAVRRAAAAAKAGDTELAERVKDVFDRFLRSGSPDQVYLAAAAEPERVGATAGILTALERTDLLDRHRDELMRCLGRALWAGSIPYERRYRELARADRRPLTAAILRHDRAWFLEHLRTLLGRRASEAAENLWMAIQGLGRHELDALATELEALGDLPDTYRARLVGLVRRALEALPAAPAE